MILVIIIITITTYYHCHYYKLESVQNKFSALCHSRFSEGVCYSNYEGMLARLNISTLHWRRRHLDALFLINIFKNKISYSSIFDSVTVRIPTRIITDYSIFLVNHNFKVSPSARCVSVANPICKDIDIFEKDYRLLLLMNQNWAAAVWPPVYLQIALRPSVRHILRRRNIKTYFPLSRTIAGNLLSFSVSKIRDSCMQRTCIKAAFLLFDAS
jgi:hypothetical protein